GDSLVCVFLARHCRQAAGSRNAFAPKLKWSTKFLPKVKWMAEITALNNSYGVQVLRATLLSYVQQSDFAHRPAKNLSRSVFCFLVLDARRLCYFFESDNFKYAAEKRQHRVGKVFGSKATANGATAVAPHLSSWPSQPVTAREVALWHWGCNHSCRNESIVIWLVSLRCLGALQTTDFNQKHWQSDILLNTLAVPWLKPFF
ncbi:hypothetical protein NPIL_692931, partial [Nephila pilipes]